MEGEGRFGPYEELMMIVLFCLKVGRNSLENTLLKYGAKDYFFKASICKFCINAESAMVCDWGGGCLAMPVYSCNCKRPAIKSLRP